MNTYKTPGGIPPPQNARKIAAFPPLLRALCPSALILSSWDLATKVRPNLGSQRLSPNRPTRWCTKVSITMPRLRLLLCLSLAALLLAAPTAIRAPQAPSPDAPTVRKIEPPNWWIGLTPELMLLIYGHKLDATHVICNLNTVHVSRTQSTAGGDYLFVWLRITPDARSGTAVCRIATANGETSFELPLANRQPTLGKFQGLAPQDAMYLIVPDRFANGDPTNDEPKLSGSLADDNTSNGSSANDDHASAHTSRSAAANGSAPTLDRSKPRAYHGGDLRGIRDHLAYLQDLGVTTLWLTPVVKNGAAEDYHGYGATDLYAIDPHLGTLSDYQELVSAAHVQKMKVLFDIVPNHVGPRHPWASNPPMPDWFHGTVAHHLTSASLTDPAFYGAAAGA